MNSNDVSVDAFGNVYITGTTSGLIRGSEVESYGTVSGAFITKHDSSGMLVWTKQFGAGGYTEGHGVSTDAFGNVYVSGYTDGDLDGGGAAANAGGSDAFLRKYDSSGTLAWTQHLGTSEDDASHGVTTDALGNVYVSGYTEGDLDGSGTRDVRRRQGMRLLASMIVAARSFEPSSLGPTTGTRALTLRQTPWGMCILRVIPTAISMERDQGRAPGTTMRF